MKEITHYWDEEIDKSMIVSQETLNKTITIWGIGVNDYESKNKSKI